MKLFRHGPPGQEKPALLDPQGQARDLSGVIDDIRAETLAPAGLQKLRAIDPQSLPLIATPGRIGVPFANPGKFICVGLNYADHAAETGAEVPKEPILFSKWSRPTGANDPLGGGTGRHHRHPGTLHLARNGPITCGRLLRYQRRIRTRIPIGARRHLGQGQASASKTAIPAPWYSTWPP